MSLDWHNNFTEGLFMSLYTQRGVSADKPEVHNATKHLDKGLYPHAFCKIYPDYLGGDPNWINVMHADGAGTKSIIAYLYWKETGDLSVWKGIAQDAIVMNLDDLACVGLVDNVLYTSTIDRNKVLIPGEVLEAVINGTQEFFDTLKAYHINIHYLGGETADVGDVVRTIAVNGTMTARGPKNKLITNEKIKAGNVIVGFASFGQALYETSYNSGLGSNGLTSARHDILSKYYAKKFPESFDPNIDPNVQYIGRHRLTDEVMINSQSIQIGKLLLSPTRTYAPLVYALLEENYDDIHGIIHCSGGGQTKCLKYLPDIFHIVKDNLFETPPIFNLIQQASGVDDREMHKVFNKGHRLEVFTTEKAALDLIEIAKGFKIEGRIIGHVEGTKNTMSTLAITPYGSKQIVGYNAD
jgi:phosphoribosylformylglycinamidine cyclo-ligase